jgi:hypothetical protein
MLRMRVSEIDACDVFTHAKKTHIRIKEARVALAFVRRRPQRGLSGR